MGATEAVDTDMENNSSLQYYISGLHLLKYTI